jgi:hypothetical protein
MNNITYNSKKVNKRLASLVAGEEVYVIISRVVIVKVIMIEVIIIGVIINIVEMSNP